MSEGKDKTQRRVYVLPTELVERIVAFQMSHGLGSEVEAARRLLDDALKQRDNFITITNKLVEKQRDTRSQREAAREVLADHPLVKSITFSDSELSFVLANGFRVDVTTRGSATVYDENSNVYDFAGSFEERPDWLSSAHGYYRKPLRRPAPDQSKKPEIDLDDDIPF